LAYQTINNNSAAVDAFKKVVSIDPDNYRAWILMGNAFSGLGKHEQAVAARKEGLKINPNDSNGWALLARSYSLNDQIDESIYAIKKALELKEYDVDYRYLGFQYSLIEMNKSMRNRSYQQNFEDQLEAYRKAVSVGPKNPKNYPDLLNVLERTGRCSEHEEIFIILKNLDRFEAIEYSAQFKKGYRPKCNIPD
jgi:tetratricopeptide (TPR) repeat protein